MLNNERPCRPFKAGVGGSHEFVAGLCGEVREESRVDQQGKRMACVEGKSKMRQCVHWEMGAHWRGAEWSLPVERHDVRSHVVA